MYPVSRSSGSRTSITVGAVGDERLELVDRDAVGVLVAAAEHVPGDVEERHRLEPADRVACLVDRLGEHAHRLRGVEHESRLGREARAGDGHVDRTRAVPGEVRRAGRTSSSCAGSGGAASSCASGSAPKKGPWFVSTMRVRFGGFGALTAADSAMNAATVPI